MLRSSFLVHFLYCNSWFLYWKLVENTFFALNAFLRFLCRQHFWLRHYFTFIGFFMLHMLLNGWHYYVVPQRLPKPNLQISFSCKGKSIIVTENLYFRPILIIFLLLIKFVLSLNYREHNCSYKSLSFYINQGPITAHIQNTDNEENNLTSIQVFTLISKSFFLWNNQYCHLFYIN